MNFIRGLTGGRSPPEPDRSAKPSQRFGLTRPKERGSPRGSKPRTKKDAVSGADREKKDGFSPDQRFFIGFAQWACQNQRPENLRANAITNPHSPDKYRVNGIVSNLPEFAKAFECKETQPMVRAHPCRVW